MNNPNKIIIHHSLTKDSRTVSWSAIRKFHKANKFDDIGYHFGIENVRGHTEILFGRFPNVKGAHCRGYNTNSIGICVVGNFDKKQPSKEKWEALKKLIFHLLEIYPIYQVVGHGEFNPLKSCPGKMFDMDKLRDETIGEIEKNGF